MPALIAFNLGGIIVLAAAEFDRKAQSRKVEIEHIGSDRLLVPEAIAVDLAVA